MLGVLPDEDWPAGREVAGRVAEACGVAEAEGVAERPAAFERVAPPLATARAAAESAALVPGRTGVPPLADAGRDELDEDAPDEDALEEGVLGAGGGATGRVVSALAEPGREPPDDGRLPDVDELEEPDDPEEPEEPEEPDELGELLGAGAAAGRENADGRDDAGGVEPEDEGLGAAAGVDREPLELLELLEPLPAPSPEAGGVVGRDGAAAGRDGAAAGRDAVAGRADALGGVGRFEVAPVMIGVDTVGAGEAGGRVGGVNADPGLAPELAVFAAGVAAGAAEPSGRAPDGRTRVVSSATPSLDSVDVTFGDASVVIGSVPPPGIFRGVLSDLLPWSELTSQPPCSSSRRGTPSLNSVLANRSASANKVHRTPLFGRY